MKTYLIFIAILFSAVNLSAQHNAGDEGKVLMIVSNPAVSEQTGWNIGVWFSELTHPYWEFTSEGYTVDLASPEGGEIRFDAFSDPEDESAYAAFDYVSLGFKKDPNKMALTRNTKKLSTVNPDDYKAIFVCGGQGPMYTFYENQELHRFFANFYETGKPTAAICHGTCILLKTKLSNGKYLVEGKTWTGFANEEEKYADDYVGFQIQPFWIGNKAKQMANTNYITGKAFDSFAVRDGNLITGQQQNSGGEAARLVLEALEEDKQRFPTYVLVHGAWADESAWGFVRDQLAVHANVEVVNLVGHGVDMTPADQISLADYVKGVEKAIKKYDKPVTLVGHSLAGVVVSQVAENMPERIEKLVYVSAYLPQDGESLLTLAQQDGQSKVGPNIEYSKDGASATIKEASIVPGVCADCPDFMKDILIKYHQGEPTKPMTDKVHLTA
ncbi:MAG: alpha/beta fold hydrolase, partial [Bacteroidota bacterium]